MKGGALLFLVCFSSGFLRGLDLHSGGQLSKSQSSMDIHHYDIDLKVVDVVAIIVALLITLLVVLRHFAYFAI